jgi:nucleotide-binding universal stress UspA family protein
MLEAIVIRLKTILVPTDFSGCSDAALRSGYALADAFGATVHLLYVVQDPYTLPWAADGFTAPIGDLLADWQAQAKRRLAESVPLAATSKTVVETQVGSPHVEIVRYAARHSMDLIVIGAARSRGPLGHMLLGSVAERVVRTAPCPVLTVRHPQREFVADAPVEQAFIASRIVTAGKGPGFRGGCDGHNIRPTAAVGSAHSRRRRELVHWTVCARRIQPGQAFY